MRTKPEAAAERTGTRNEGTIPDGPSTNFTTHAAFITPYPTFHVVHGVILNCERRYH